MRDFSWKYFTLTGDVESFMLYKEMNQLGAEGRQDPLASADDELALMDVEESSG
ncbi:YqzL family protein [Paenibacillus arenilitoris]|uniref:YqzL family protein n=1 Tax=Paenibacillus arenilitoris TaxID=2772299 RepID=A0A927H5H9_9BACL|nr:YqzL family protein [Paenibacillus arenilitoris]MBD2869491.1 YqzL family protein [Paenibacillus arenilitoris]